MEDKEQLANKLVNNFINNFYETFGVKPKVVYKIDASIPTLNQIFDAVQEEFNKVMPGRLLEEKTRDATFIKYRGIYYSIARYFKYSCHSIGLLCNKDHATVLHNLKNVPENSELKNKIIQKLKTINY